LNQLRRLRRIRVVVLKDLLRWSRIHYCYLLFGALQVVGPAVAHAGATEELTPEALLNRAFENLYGSDYIQTIELETRQREGRSVRRRLQVVRRQSVRPGKALLRFLEPYDIRRTAILVLENEGANDDLYIYLPAIRLTRRISAAQRADAFFGTDLSYEDIEPKRAEDYRVEWAPEDAPGECLVMLLRPRAGIDSSYEMMRACIEIRRSVIEWMDFYRRGEIVKRMESVLDSVREVEEHHIPFEITFRSMNTGSTTKVTTERYEVRDALPDSLFSTWNLEAGDAARDRKHARSGGDS
jgi:hypothetical protein